MALQPDTRGRLRRLWDWFWSPTAVLSVGFTLIAGFVAGILFWGGFHWAVEASNTEEFCVSCHSMETNLGEYRETVHYNNHSGVRAICSDCHVPKEWNHKMKAKVMAVKDIWFEMTGSINTPEKYEERRLKMALAVWKKMKASDSRECRNCHAFEYMDFTLQETRAGEAHQRAIDQGMTCIDCHQGIAHDLPPNYQQEYEKLTRSMAINPATDLSQSAAVVDDGTLRAYLQQKH